MNAFIRQIYSLCIVTGNKMPKWCGADMTPNFFVKFYLLVKSRRVDEITLPHHNQHSTVILLSVCTRCKFILWTLADRCLWDSEYQIILSLQWDVAVHFSFSFVCAWIFTCCWYFIKFCTLPYAAWWKSPTWYVIC